MRFLEKSSTTRRYLATKIESAIIKNHTYFIIGMVCLYGFRRLNYWIINRECVINLGIIDISLY